MNCSITKEALSLWCALSEGSEVVRDVFPWWEASQELSILPPIPLSPLQVQNTGMAGSRARALFWLRAGGIVTSLHSVMTTGTGVVVPDSSPLDLYHYPGLNLILQVLLEMTSEINPL